MPDPQRRHTMTGPGQELAAQQARRAGPRPRSPGRHRSALAGQVRAQAPGSHSRLCPAAHLAGIAHPGHTAAAHRLASSSPSPAGRTSSSAPIRCAAARAGARQEAAGRPCAVRADLPGLRQRHRRCVRPRIPGFSPGGLGPHLTSSGSPAGFPPVSRLPAGFSPIARLPPVPRRPAFSGSSPSAVAQVPVPPFGVPPGSPSLGQSSR